MIKIVRTDSAKGDFLVLEAKLDHVLAELNGDKHAFYAPLNRSDLIRNVVIAYIDESAVGCGAFRFVSEKEVEIKRMFTAESTRGNGVGKAILRELEKWAAELGYTAAILETSWRLHSAVSLYQKSGYSVIPNYGVYCDVEDSVCMRKTLAVD